MGNKESRNNANQTSKSFGTSKNCDKNLVKNSNMDNEKRRKNNENSEMEIETRRKVTAVVIGCGQRGTGYSNYSRQFPDLLQIVGVADPKKNRRYF